MLHYICAVFMDEYKEEKLFDLLSPYLSLPPYLSDYCKNKENVYKKTFNHPHIKLDRYRIGGPFNEILSLKNGEKAYIAKVSDIDFSINQKTYEKALRFWETCVEEKPQNQGKIFPSYFKKEFYQDIYKTKEYFAKTEATFLPFAFLSSETGWQESGKISWLYSLKKYLSKINFIPFPPCPPHRAKKIYLMNKGDLVWAYASEESLKEKKAFEKKFMDFIKSPENQDKILVAVDCSVC